MTEASKPSLTKKGASKMSQLTKQQIEEVSQKASNLAHAELTDKLGDYIEDACYQTKIEQPDYDQLNEEVEPLMRKKLIAELGGVVIKEDSGKKETYTWEQINDAFMAMGTSPKHIATFLSTLSKVKRA